MDQKKYNKVNLDKVRQLLFSIGLLFITGVVLLVLTFTTYDKNIYELILEIEDDVFC